MNSAPRQGSQSGPLLRRNSIRLITISSKQSWRRTYRRLDTQKHPKAESYTLIKEYEEALAAFPEEDKAGRARNRKPTLTRCASVFSAKRSSAANAVPMRRAFDEIREIWIEVGVLPRTHGSSVFTRGETQALVTCTLGTTDDMQRLETFQGEAKKHFMLHYNFPPFSVGEVSFLRGAGRREIGHGALAERAVSAVLPTQENWPYAMRVVSDILESNGSSSMATICGASLCADGCGRSHQSSGCWCCHGIGKGG